MNSDSVKPLLDRFLERSFDRPASCFLRSLEACLFIVELQGKNGRLLDIGCGDGFFDSLLPDEGIDFVGIDIELDNLKKSDYLNTRKKHVINSSASYLPLKDGIFKYVISNSSIEHFHDLNLVIDQIHRVVKTGGSTILSLPLRNPSIRKNWLEELIERTYIKNHGVRNYLTDQEWIGLFENKGFKIVKKTYYLHSKHGKRVFLLNFIFNLGLGKVRLYVLIKKLSKVFEAHGIFIIKNFMKKIAGMFFGESGAVSFNFSNDPAGYYNALYVLMSVRIRVSG